MSSVPLHIRPYQTADEAAVIRLWEVCGLIRPWNDPRKDIARKLTVQPELFLVGLENARVVACVMAGYDGHRGWVNYLAVDPACQRRGHARALMQAVEDGLLALGCPKLSLQVRRGNSAVLEFYDRLGFTVDDTVSLGKRLISDLPAAG
ncbi:GNAT family acetyltransferase [Bordetella sp. 2513F-2]